jgi:hypothetical protein
VIEFFFHSECIFWDLYQLVSPGARVSAQRTLKGLARASGTWHFFLYHFVTLLHMHSPVGGE